MLATPSLVGWLVLDAGWARLYPREPDGNPPVEVCQGLYEPTVTKIRGDSILIVGDEWRSRFDTRAPYRQAWWCRVLRGGLDPR